MPVEVAPTGPITITFWETDANDADVLLDELAAAFPIQTRLSAWNGSTWATMICATSFAPRRSTGSRRNLCAYAGEFAGPFSELNIIWPLDAIFDEISWINTLRARWLGRP